MDLMFAVIDELATFAIDSIRGGVRRIGTHSNRDGSHHVREQAHHEVAHHEVSHSSDHGELHTHVHEDHAVLRPERLVHKNVEVPSEEVADPVAPHAHLETVFSNPPKRNTVVYVGTSQAPLRSSPQSGTDNVIARMPYGSMLVAMESVGTWIHAFYRGIEGYVEFRDLALHAGDVYPKFVLGEANVSDDPNTERVRGIIGDEFSCGEANMPLQAEEYVLYKLTRNGITVPWSSVRPRTPGSWARSVVLGVGVEQAAEPRPRAVMEWVQSGEKGFLAYVESVQPDGTITISEANWPENGIYNERILVREEWEALAPTFLYFS